MGLFGKKKITETEIASQFVIALAKEVEKCWPTIVKELRQLLQSDQVISDDEDANFEFTLAVIATQIQALPNLLKQEQASRIRNYILMFFSSRELGSFAKEAIDAYQDAWDTALEQGELPLDGIASVLYDKLECGEIVEFGGEKFKDPILIMALSEQVAKFCIPWWKNVIEKYKIVP